MAAGDSARAVAKRRLSFSRGLRAWQAAATHLLGRVAIRKLDRDYCIATWDCVLIQLWRREVTAEAVGHLIEITRSFSEEQARPVCSIAVIERTSPPPAEQVRSSLSRFYRDFAADFASAVVVAEGGGFRSALVRGVGVALSMLAPKTLPFEFVATVRQAAVIIGGHLSAASGGATGLERSVEEVRMQLEREQTSAFAIRTLRRH